MTDKKTTATSITRPLHYQSKTGLEAWDIVEAFDLDFYTGNAVKYICRAGKKTTARRVDDLRKAITFLEKRVSLFEESSS